MQSMISLTKRELINLILRNFEGSPHVAIASVFSAGPSGEEQQVIVLHKKLDELSM